MATQKAAETLPARLGARVRALRRREGLSQSQFAAKLGISPSYVNLIENNHRPLSAGLLIKMAQLFHVDLAQFSQDGDGRLVSDLIEAFADPLFEAHDMTTADVHELAVSAPTTARAVLSLYRAYQDTRKSLDDLAGRVVEGDGTSITERGVPSAEVSDFIQAHWNYFPEMEDRAADLLARMQRDGDDVESNLRRYLSRKLGIEVRYGLWGEDRSLLRHYDEERKVIFLSELLPTRARRFQLAHQAALLTCKEPMDRLIAQGGEHITTDESKKLARIALANYFAGAVLMPYDEILAAARSERYDLDVIGRRFRVGFEQVCQRLTSLRKPGAEGVPFHMIRVDAAGNISKRFSASGIGIARFSGICPRWNVFSAFQTPGMIRIQYSIMPNGETFFCIARSIQKDSTGYRSQQPVMAIGLGCPADYAKELVYSDGVDVADRAHANPIGVTCRTCEREDCEQRAVPSVRSPLHLDENVRGLSLYATPRLRRGGV